MMQMTAPPYWSTSPKRPQFWMSSAPRVGTYTCATDPPSSRPCARIARYPRKTSPNRDWREGGRQPPPDLDQPVSDGDHIAIGSAVGDVYDVSGHTIGHIAVHFAEQDIVFTADSLMALGCGRLFEGSAEQMWSSLSKLARYQTQQPYAQATNTLWPTRVLP